jgi:hypothetical protein
MSADSLTMQPHTKLYADRFRKQLVELVWWT